MGNFKNIGIVSSSLTRDYRKNTCMYNSLRVIYCKGCRCRNFLQKYTFFIISCKENSKNIYKKENINRIENYLNRTAKLKHYCTHTQTLSLIIRPLPTSLLRVLNAFSALFWFKFWCSAFFYLTLHTNNRPRLLFIGLLAQLVRATDS